MTWLALAFHRFTPGLGISRESTGQRAQAANSLLPWCGPVESRRSGAGDAPVGTSSDAAREGENGYTRSPQWAVAEGIAMPRIAQAQAGKSNAFVTSPEASICNSMRLITKAPSLTWCPHGRNRAAWRCPRLVHRALLPAARRPRTRLGSRTRCPHCLLPAGWRHSPSRNGVQAKQINARLHLPAAGPREHPHGVFPVPWCDVLEREVQPHINLVRFQRPELDLGLCVPVRRSRVEIFVTREQAEPVCEVIPDAAQRL